MIPPAATTDTGSETQGLGVPERAAALVALSGPYHRSSRPRVEGSPVGTLALVGGISAFRMATTVLPYRVVSRAVDDALGGPAATPEQVAQRQRMMLLGNAATVAAGILAQRAVTHSRWHGAPADLARVTAAQVSIGGAASALTLLSDMAAGTQVDDDPQSPAGQASQAVVALAQRWILRRVAAVVTLPPRAGSATIPVRSRWRTREVSLPLLQ